MLPAEEVISRLMRAEFEKTFTDAHMHRNEKMRFGYLPQYQDLYEGFEAGYNAAVSAMSALGWRKPGDA